MPLDGQPLVQQLLGGELSLTLAYLFPEITPCRKAAKAARKILSSGMLELIEANMGDLPLIHKAIIAFSVGMLMTMIIWLTKPTVTAWRIAP